MLERDDYLPFGEEWPPRPDQAHIGFGGMEKDPETGNGSWMALNYVGARSLETSTGRFTSVDPFVDAKLAIVEPQAWNRYSYVTNNGLKFVDPDGRRKLDAVMLQFYSAVFGVSFRMVDTRSGAVGSGAWRRRLPPVVPRRGRAARGVHPRGWQ